MAAGRQMLDFRHAVHRIVVRLAHHRAVHPEPIGETNDFGNPPGTEIADPEVADFSLAYEVAQGRHGLLEWRADVLLVQVIDVDISDPETPQAGFGRCHDPFAAQSLAVRSLAHRIADFGCQHPPVAVAGDSAADDLLRPAMAVLIGSVDEVDADRARLADD